MKKNPQNFEDLYKTAGKIDTGGFGAVYRCKHVPTGELRAVKYIRKNVLEDHQYEAVQHEIDI